MGRTAPRFHAVHLPLRWGYDRMRHLPLQTDRELNHQQRCNHPVCGSLTHDPQRTPVAVMKEER
jgi:hypothetical protein